MGRMIVGELVLLIIFIIGVYFTLRWALSKSGNTAPPFTPPSPPPPLPDDMAEEAEKPIVKGKKPRRIQ